MAHLLRVYYLHVRKVRVAYLGNFGPSHSTESHVAASLESLGHDVLRIQEGETPAADVPVYVERFEADIFLHTQTQGLALSSGSYEERCIMVETLNDLLPTAFFHLDRWWGLERQQALLNIDREPWTRYHHVFTADGGHDGMWQQIGVNHHWLPPAVYHAEAIDGTPRREYQCDVAFVGSWRNYGHSEWWPHRKKMIDTMTRKFGRNFRCFPMRQAVRGMDLTDLYASVKVVVGDSCLVPNVHGQPIARYWSDRIPETMGRGGLLVHPFVHGLPEVHPHLVTAGDLDQLVYHVSHLLKYPDDANHIRALQARNTRECHTYLNRMTTLLETVLS